MFSKPASAADVRPNKNMTSFKNKISQRKRKNGSATEIDTSSEVKQSENNQQKGQKERAGKQRNRKNSGKKETSSEEPSKTVNNKPDVAASVNVLIENVDFPDVVLRNDKRCNSIDNVNKRYSDSFMIENGKEDVTDTRHSAIERPGLTRAVSGFLVVDHSKKNRRFSDLFRPKLSCSTENLKMSTTPNCDNKSAKSDNTTNNKNKRNSNANESSPAKFITPKVPSKKETSNTKTTPTSQTSYLKRVRSKIYKSKSDDTSKIDLDKSKKLKTKKSIECNGRIPEDEVAVLTPAGLRKSLTNFDFKLVRQTSNLERSMTRGFFGSRKSIDEVDGEVANPKPVLEKSKSSSAINLNLLRARRNKLMEQAAAWKQAASNCKDEFDFIAFGAASKLSGSTTSLHKFPSWLHLNKPQQNIQEHPESSEGKTGHPVSRSGSDRRPDAVREEPHRHQDSEASRTEVQNTGDNDKAEGGTPDSSISLPITGNRRKVGSNINRSESVKEQSEKRKQRRNISDPSHNTSCDVDLERQQTSFTKNTDSGSSSNSNVSCNGRLSESPSNSVDVHHASLRTNSESDSDMDEADPLTWQQLLPEEEVKNLSAHEKKRQDVINELFHTEGSHVRNLKVLYKIFYRRLHESQILKPDDLNLIFPNIKEMLDIHTEINKEMRRIRKEDPLVKETLGDSLVKMFCGPQGEALQKAAAIFCERQQLALEFIKKRRERDSKFDSLLTECEKKRQCRRLPLQGIVPTEMQRLSKYPLLLERLIGSIDHKDPSQADELAKLKRVQQMSREILNYVNEAAKVALNKHRLEEIQSHLDPALFERADHSIVGEFRNFDLTRYKLLLEGSMQLRRPNKAILPVHVLLLEEMVVILHKESEKYLLKFFQSGSPAQPQPLSPIIKINTLLVRSNAVCKNSLFLISSSTSTSQMYDLIAEDDTKRNWWFRHFTDAAEAHNIREGKPSKRPGAGVIGVVTADTESESDHELPTPTTTHSAERSSEVTEEVSDGEKDSKREDTAEEVESSEVGGGGDLQVDGDRAESQEPEMIGGGGGDEKIKVTAEEWPLIQPSQVNVAIPPVHTAETTLTPLEQIRRKDALVKQALAEKEGLVADMLSIPREDFHHIADMASADVASGGGHLTERLLASIFQVNQLQKAVNSSLDITEADVIAAKGGKHPACASQDVPAQEKSVIPIVPVSLVAEIAASLSSQLTTLLSEVKEVVKERDMLRKEFDKVKERLHEEHNLHSPVQYEECNSDESGTEIFSEAATGEIQ